MKFIFVILGVCVFSVTTSLNGRPPKSISLDEIGVQYEIIGRLGVPMGTIVKVVCRGYTPAEDDPLTKGGLWKLLVEVLAVDDRKLTKPMLIQWSVFSTDSIEQPEPGKEITVFCYESLHSSGVPYGADDYITAPQDTSWNLRSVLVALSKTKKTRANQALVPTPASVTPAADAPVAPDAGAAHL